MPYDLIILGSGAAGLSAALYAGRYRMKTLVIGKEFGGETARAGVIWNYPGAKGIDGYDLMLAMKAQAEDVGATVMDDAVVEAKNEGGCYEVKTMGGKIFNAKSLILSMGAERKRLGLANEKDLTGRGVHYCFTCDGPVYTGKTIAVVGGGDASIKGVNLASEYAKKIYLLVRGKELKAEPINVEEMMKMVGDKVEILYETKVEAIFGEKKLEKLVLSKPHNGSSDFLVDGLFIEIGAEPNIKLPMDLGIALDQWGYVKVDNMMRTNVDGVCAAGDSTNFFERFKQDITAAAMGAVAATSAYNYTKSHGNLCEIHWKPAPDR